MPQRDDLPDRAAFGGVEVEAAGIKVFAASKTPPFAIADPPQASEELRLKYGKDVEKLPLGAVGIYTASQKIRTGLQQLMAGSRNFNLSTITRRDLMSLTEECESVTRIPYVMRAYRKEAEKILAQ